MRRLLLTLTLTLVLCAAAVAQPKRGRADPLVVQGDTITVVKTLPCKVIAPTGGSLYTWSYPREVRAVKDGNVLTVQQAPKGVFVVSCTITIVDFDKKTVSQDDLEVEVNYGGDVPGPPPPPPPPPPPNPAPIPSDGFRVLMVYSTAATPTPGQQAVLEGKEVRDYLNAKCVPDSNAESGRGWRIWDKDADLSKAPKLWQDAMKRPRASVPWIVVSNGKTGFEGPLPADPAEALKLLAKYAEVK